MTTAHDDYSDLPPISLGDQLDLDDLQPEHFTITDEALAASRDGEVLGLFHAVRYQLGHLGEDEVIRVTAKILLAGRDIIEQALNTSGDVTQHE